MELAETANEADDRRWVKEELERQLAEAAPAGAGAGGERRRGSTITSQQSVEALATSGEDWGAVTVVDSAHQQQMTDVVLGGGGDGGAAELAETANEADEQQRLAEASLIAEASCP